MFRRCQIPTLVAGMLILLMASSVMAQGNQPQDPSGAGTQPQISEAEMQKVATAFEQIILIRQDFEQALQRTEDAAERQQLQDDANKKMVQAVGNAGIDVDTYNRVMRQIQTDEELSQKFMEMTQKTH